LTNVGQYISLFKRATAMKQLNLAEAKAKAKLSYLVDQAARG